MDDLKYNFIFSRQEAEVMLEVLNHWKQLFTMNEEDYDLYDYFEMNRMKVLLKLTNYLINKIIKQKLTKKKTLNFITRQPALSHLKVCLSVEKNKMVKKINDLNDDNKKKIIQEELNICENVIERMNKTPFIGQSKYFLKEGTNELKDFFKY